MFSKQFISNLVQKKKKHGLENCWQYQRKKTKLFIEAEKSMGWELVTKANAIQEFALVKCSIISELPTSVMNLANSKKVLKRFRLIMEQNIASEENKKQQTVKSKLNV